jgi:integrase
MNHQPVKLEIATREVTLEVLPPAVIEPPKLSHAITLANLWTVWMGLKSTAQPATVLIYQHVARKFCKFFQNAHSNELGPKLDPQGMVAWMQNLQAHRSAYLEAKPLSPARINKINDVARAFLRWLHIMRYIGEDLARCIPKLQAPAPGESKIVTEDEYERIKAYCAGRPRLQAQLWLIILGYRTGMSLVDCCHLRWRDVHLDDNGPSYIDIKRIKIARLGDKAKCRIPIVPMSDIHLWLLNMRNVTPWKRADGVTDYVHQETQGLYNCTFSNLRQDFKRIFRMSAVAPGKTFKCLRNSLCSNLVNSGMQLALVCTITGHNSVKTLLRYLEPDRNSLEHGMAEAQRYSAAKASKIGTGMQEPEVAEL